MSSTAAPLPLVPASLNESKAGLPRRMYGSVLFAVFVQPVPGSGAKPAGLRRTWPPASTRGGLKSGCREANVAFVVEKITGAVQSTKARCANPQAETKEACHLSLTKAPFWWRRKNRFAQAGADDKRAAAAQGSARKRCAAEIKADGFQLRKVDGLRVELIRKG